MRLRSACACDRGEAGLQVAAFGSIPPPPPPRARDAIALSRACPNLNMGRAVGGGVQAGVKPASYRLEFEPDLPKAKFDGRASIAMDCSRPVSEVVLDAAELRILSVRAEDGGGAAVPARARLEGGREALVLSLGRRVRGRLTVEIEYEGTLNDRLLGFYLSEYRQEGRTRRLATTQFEAADARRAFPCFDEPGAKATFDISIIARGGDTAISNMPVASKKSLGSGKGGGTRTRYTFETTPIMSTYLVYLGVGDFESIGGRTDDGVAVRVVAVRGRAREGRYALGLAKSLLGLYGRYFGSPYPLPKLDLIAVPDFAAGAMENWGAITFREAVLLYDPKTSSTRTKQFIAEVVSHEIAHQWFGNLVTMRWWNDLWLNESFATFMATKFVDMLHPEWDMWEQFAGDAVGTAMSLDALHSTHPIDVDVASPSEIREIFDAISYDKGGSILLMVEDYVGEAAFKRGLRKYLKDHAYGNAAGGDLWDAIGRASGLPVRRLVQAWIGREGFPVVEASRGAAGRGGGQGRRKLRLRQERFTYEPRRVRGGRRGGAAAAEAASWPIPVSVGLAVSDGAGGGGGGAGGRRGAAGVGRPALFSRRSGSIEAPAAARGRAAAPRHAVAVVNRGRRGFYRVRYDQEMMLDVRHAVTQGSIQAIDRWGIHNDLYAMCMAGRATLGEYLDMVDAYSGDQSYLVCADISASLRSLWARTYNEPYSGIIAGYARRHFAGVLDRLGWDARRGERHTDALLRGGAVSALGALGDASTIAEARSRFDAHYGGSDPLAADLRDAVYSVVAWSSPTPRTFSRLVSLYGRTQSQEEHGRILGGGLASLGDTALLRRGLDFALGKRVRSQNVHVVVVRAASNPRGTGVVWPWVRSNWRTVSSKVGRGNPLLSRIVSCLSQPGAGAAVGPRARRSGRSHYGEVAGFFARNGVPGTERAVEQTLERMRVASAFLERSRSEMGWSAAGLHAR